MGYTILAQWTVPQPPGNLGNLILIRLLEHYNLSYQTRSSIHFRTFKATFPNPTGDQTKNLSVISYSQPSAGPTREQVSIVRDDTTYLFLDDPNTGPSTAMGSGSEAQESNSVPNPSTRPAPERQMSLDGFEIIDAPSSIQPRTTTPASPIEQSRKGKQKERYALLAVRPSTSPLALLQNIMSPFVMGFTKSAKSAASTTAQTSTLTPTPLPGQTLLMTTFTFPALAPPAPPLVVNLHQLPQPTASTIFLEIEDTGSSGGATADDLLKEYVEGCLPENIQGITKYHRWENDGEASKVDKKGWEGLERTRRCTLLLAKALREGGMI